MTITGGCRCGAVRYTIEAERVTARHCWCRDCQYIGAGSGTVNVFFPSKTVTVEGVLSDFASRAASGNLVHQQFCPTCRTPVFTQSEARLHPDRRPRRYTRRSRDRQARHDHLDFERTELGRIRSKYPNSPCHPMSGLEKPRPLNLRQELLANEVGSA
jgi:hypothetical protein